MIHERPFDNGSIIYDDTGDWVVGSGVAFPPATIVPSEGAPFWRTDLGQWCRYTAGAWSTDTEFTGDTHFKTGLHVHGAGDTGGIKWFAGQGDQTTEAHSHEGVITVDLDLAGASSAASVATFIPPRSLVWRAAVEVLTTFTGGSVTKFDVGVTGGDLAAIFSDVSMIDDGDFNANVSLAVVTGNNAAGGVTVSAQTAGGAAATVTTGKVRVTLWTSTIDGPDGSAYA